MSTRATTLIGYGATGSGKTTSIGHLARHVKATTGKITRLVSFNSSGIEVIQPDIDDGLIEVWHVGAMVYREPSGTMRKLIRGDWPVQNVGGTALRFEPATAKTWERVGAYVFEDLSTIGDAIMNAIKGQKIAENPSMTYNEGGETFYNPGKAHYGFVQNRLYEFVRDSGLLPVSYTMWTSIEAEAEESTEQGVRGGKKVYGPAIAGKASIGKCPTWFGDCLHFDKVLVKTGKKDEQTGADIIDVKRRVYLADHADAATGIIYPAKVRIPAARMEDFRKEPKFHEGRFYEPSLTGGLDWLLEIEERLRKGQAVEAKK
jgi:energy-coupling factor transporter ATP-binding protein EcfA2